MFNEHFYPTLIDTLTDKKVIGPVGSHRPVTGASVSIT